jgi:two-component system OmpR family response regulator/two-component system response regulator RstA
MPASYRLLLVEDDAELASMVADYLTPQDFDVAIEGRGDLAIARIASEKPDVVVLDVNLPGMDGFSICRNVRTSFPGPILILTARGEEVDEVVGLEVGADDYLAKPVRPRILLARLRAHLRKSTSVDGALGRSEVISLGSLRIDASRRIVELGSLTVETTTAEFDLLWLLAQHAGKVLSRREMFEHLHGFPYDGLDRSIDLRVSRLRRKLGDDPEKPQLIKSVRGVGYLLSSES